MIAANTRTKGQSFIELTLGIAVIVPVMLILLDLSIMLIGVETNDSNCRSAARAAAAGNPEEATERAQTIIARLGNNQGMLSSSRLLAPVEVIVFSQPEPEQDIATGKQIFPGGPVIGSTTLTTEIEVRPIIVHMLYGGRTPLTFKSTHSFPISHVLPAR